MKVRLFAVPASHPSWVARKMLELKGLEYSRVDIVLIMSKVILRAAGFPGVTVPALIIDGERVQGSVAIAHELDRLVPLPPLYPGNPEARARVEEAERWGEEVLQPAARRLAWNRLSKDRRPIRSYLEGSRLGVPLGLAARTAAPIAYLSARFNEATDANAILDLAALPANLDRIDAWIDAGVIGGEVTNAADLQIGSSLALLLTMDDLRPHIEGRPCGQLAVRLYPEFPGRMPAAYPAAWLEPLTG